MHQDLREFPRSLIFDTLREKIWSSKNGYEEINTFPDLCKRLIENPAFFRISYRQTTVRMITDFLRVCEAVLCCKSLVFGVEECYHFQSPASMPLGLEIIITTGRHREISFFSTTQRPQGLHPLIRSQASQIVSFVQNEPRDIQWIKDCMGEEIALKVQQLGLHKYIRWVDSASGEQSQ